MASLWKVLGLILIFYLLGETRSEEPENPPKDNYHNPPFDPTSHTPTYSKAGTRLITLNELAAHASVNGTLRPHWLAIMGRVYDVDKGHTHYGPEGGYNFFTGRDGSKAFVTGEFNDIGLTDDVSGLTPLQLLDIEGWVEFYNKEYTYVGKLIGRYHDRNGNPTKEWYKYRKRLAKGKEEKEEKAAEEREFPPCNSRFTQGEGGIVFCSTKRQVHVHMYSLGYSIRCICTLYLSPSPSSNDVHVHMYFNKVHHLPSSSSLPLLSSSSGGIERDWEGLPRRYFTPGSKNWRCACVNEKDLNSPQIQLYPGCPPQAKECSVDDRGSRNEL